MTLRIVVTCYLSRSFTPPPPLLVNIILLLDSALMYQLVFYLTFYGDNTVVAEIKDFKTLCL